MNNRIMYRSSYFLLGGLNILILMPIMLSLAVVILSLYIIDIILLATPIFLVLNIIMPNLPIWFGTDNFVVKILVTIVLTGVGYYFYKILKYYARNFFHWLLDYVKKSVTFRLFDNYILSNN